MTQRSRTVIAIGTGLASAGLVFVALPRVGSSPPANEVSRTDDVARPPSQRASLVALDPGPEAHGSAPAPRPLTVRFEGGLLAIRAHAAPLDEVLAAVTKSVGIRFVGAEDATEAVSIDAGPAPVSQVLAALLAGANYGYAFLDRSDRGGARPARVILLKQSATQRAAAAPAAHRPPVPMPQDQAMPVPADAPGVRQQQVLDELLEACKQQGCDTS